MILLGLVSLHNISSFQHMNMGYYIFIITQHLGDPNLHVVLYLVIQVLVVVFIIPDWIL